MEAVSGPSGLPEGPTHASVLAWSLSPLSGPGFSQASPSPALCHVASLLDDSLAPGQSMLSTSKGFSNILVPPRSSKIMSPPQGPLPQSHLPSLLCRVTSHSPRCWGLRRGHFSGHHSAHHTARVPVLKMKRPRLRDVTCLVRADERQRRERFGSRPPRTRASATRSPRGSLSASLHHTQVSLLSRTHVPFVQDHRSAGTRDFCAASRMRQLCRDIGTVLFSGHCFCCFNPFAEFRF